jgi:SNF2 family DNA or RNA helicase
MKYKLYKHQQKGSDFIHGNGGSGALFWEVGCGKTIGGLDIYRRNKVEEPKLKLLVFCPITLIDKAWGKDIEKFTDYKYHNLHKKLTFDPNVDVYIVNYESLISKKRFKFIKELVSEFPFMAILDESTKIKNHAASTTKNLLKLRNYFRYRLVMSGTPAPNIEWEYWPQITFIGSGILHRKFHAFKNYYFHLQRQGSMIPGGGVMSRQMLANLHRMGWQYDITYLKRNALFEILNRHCHFAKKKDCLDLPEQVDQIRSVKMGTQQAQYYKSLKKHLVAEIQNTEITAEFALSKVLKLREICSGFAIDDNRKVIEVGENPKLKELSAVLEELGSQQIIIWCEFTKEIEDLKALLGDRAVLLYGGTKDKNTVIDEFLNGEAQYLIAHPRSAAHGLTFVNCHTQIFYALSYSYENYEQCRGRTHRNGQKNQCLYIHLIVENSIEETVLGVLKGKHGKQKILEDFLNETRNGSTKSYTRNGQTGVSGTVLPKV